MEEESEDCYLLYILSFSPFLLFFYLTLFVCFGSMEALLCHGEAFYSLPSLGLEELLRDLSLNHTPLALLPPGGQSPHG